MNEQFKPPESLIFIGLLNNQCECAQQRCLDDPMETLIALRSGALAASGNLLQTRGTDALSTYLPA
jgi:hypothetical protein